MATNASFAIFQALTTVFPASYSPPITLVKNAPQLKIGGSKESLLFLHTSFGLKNTIWKAVLVLFVALSISFVYHVWYKLFSFQGLPQTLPWAGVGNTKALRRGRVSTNSLLGLRELLIHGYNNYSKQGKPFILPNIFTGHEVILPMKDMRWLLQQPDHLLNQHEMNIEFLRADHTMLDHRIFAEKSLATFIRSSLTHDLDSHATAVMEEIDIGLETFCGADSDNAKPVKAFEVMLSIVGRIANRVLVGIPLCRDPTYVEAITSFAKAIVITAGLVNLLPSWLRPILGPVITAYDHVQSRKLASIVEPLVASRAQAFYADSDLKRNSSTSYPNDYITWALRDAMNDPDPSQRSPELITKRLIVIGFAAIQSTAITITNALFDISASPVSNEIQQQLRAEARTAQFGSTGNKATLAKMSKTDSVLRESQRLWGIGTHGITKKVVAKQGVTLPSGELIPYGAKVGIASYGPHYDEAVYNNPNNFDPFRFCSENEAINRTPSGKSNVTPKTFVTTGDYYMGFSHGRNACPGRYFASQQLKLLLAQIALRYDIEPIRHRPQNIWLNNTIAPPVQETLMLKRRSDSML